ncbi:MAG: hypothetical protein AAFR91_11110 [Pseudomonadota bacterium]
MSSETPTYDRAADQVVDYVRPLWHGAPIPAFDVKDEIGRPLRFTDDYLCGSTMALLLLNTANEERIQHLLSVFAQKTKALAAAEITVVAFSADASAARNLERKQAAGFVWPIPADATGQQFAALGLHKGSGTTDRIIWITPRRTVHAWFDEASAPDAVLEQIMSELPSNTLGEMPLHPPVLIVPDVLSREECAKLIESVESGTPLAVRPPRSGELQGDYQIPVYDHNRQDRVDHIIKDESTQQFLDERIFSRVVPMVKKAFAFDVTRREDLHVARYAGNRQGNTVGHRDNITAATAHRKFALSLNLNDDYEGGDVVFKEYSATGYKGSAGAALIFSSSLLHEVRETTQGIRYTLISHFFNEQSLQSAQTPR